MQIDAQRFDAVVFDMDGVLTDTARLHEAAWRVVLDAFTDRIAPGSRRLTSSDYRELLDGRSREDGIRAFLAARGLLGGEEAADRTARDVDVVALSRDKDSEYARILAGGGVDGFLDAQRLLTALHRVGLRTGVATASHHRSGVLAAAGIDGAFDAVVDGTDLDAAGIPGKPDPGIFVEAARRLAVPVARAVVIEDSDAGVRAAVAGGFGAVVGVDRSGTHHLDASGATVVVSSLDELQVGGDQA